MAPGSRHIDDETLERFASGALTPGERAQVDAHARECGSCRALVTGLTMLRDGAARFDPGAPAVRPSPRRVWIPLAAAAAIVAAIVVPMIMRQSAATPASTVRDARVEGPAPVGPAGAVAAGSIQFEWRAAPNATSYEVSLFREDGSSVWKGVAPASPLALPPDVKLGSGRYYWRVTGMSNDGPPMESALTHFEVRP